MKNLFVRLSVLTIALSGFAASTVVSKAAPKKNEIKPVVIGGVCPTPMCMPREPGHCGMD